MTANAQKVLDDALTLSANERADLAAELLASLEETEAEVESWAVEIERRDAEARQNPTDDEDWRTALAAIQREVLSR
jgi:hypothetical protein